MRKPSDFEPSTRRDFLRSAGQLAGWAGIGVFLPTLVRAGSAHGAKRRDFDVGSHGAMGDGRTLDTAAIQRAIDAAAGAGGGRVLLRGGSRYLTGALHLRSGIDFHLADDAELVVSTDPAHFGGSGALNATGAVGLRITGTGTIDGRSPEFMERYDAANEWWVPKPFRPRLALLTGCRDVEVHDVTFRQAPSWTLHLLGCEHVLVDGMKVRNQMDVPNCDGIDPDHCRDVEIRNCAIACGDDAIVLKTTRPGAAYGPSSRIRVHDCVLETQDSGLKIGTESTQDISDVRFENCTIKTGCRGLCIQLRDEGNISNIAFQDITFTSRFFSDPWWGRGEAISFTAMPRTPTTKLGKLSGLRVQNVTGRAENSIRIDGSAQSRISDVRFENVDVTFDRWTRYPGGMWDNRPTTALAGIEPHGTCGIGIRHADDVVLKNCRVGWGSNRPDYFTHALEAEDVNGLQMPGFVGEAAHPGQPAVVVR
ncbi:MAG TPA: glycosyl hydrolase family 28 protein [Opitutaceae bacterium]|nr:glycosyl hydrolase family 28 protein [Opitutaceae bacterium]